MPTEITIKSKVIAYGISALIVTGALNCLRLCNPFKATNVVDLNAVEMMGVSCLASGLTILGLSGINSFTKWVLP